VSPAYPERITPKMRWHRSTTGHIHSGQSTAIGKSSARKRNRRRSIPMAKASRGGRMTAAKKRAAKAPGGKGPVKTRKVGKNIMKT
jgi:hypothetical protein